MPMISNPGYNPDGSPSKHQSYAASLNVQNQGFGVSEGGGVRFDPNEFPALGKFPSIV